MSYGYIAKGVSSGLAPAALMRGPMVAKVIGQMLSGTGKHASHTHVSHKSHTSLALALFSLWYRQARLTHTSLTHVSHTSLALALFALWYRQTRLTHTSLTQVSHTSLALSHKSRTLTQVSHLLFFLFLVGCSLVEANTSHKFPPVSPVSYCMFPACHTLPTLSNMPHSHVSFPPKRLFAFW